MVGHTGNLVAAKKAIFVLDKALNRVVNAILKNKAQCVITADHGNAEEMINLKTGEVDSEHSVYPVPFVFIASPAVLKYLHITRKELRKGKLADVAPTILKLMGIKKPTEMTGNSLV
jgi:2,3-bisphosphoglycerate-independent phosphoglycerate mutase